MYMIICIASIGGCGDYAPKRPWYFRNETACIVMVNKLYDAYVVDMKKKGSIIIDGKAFCLRFKETKEA